MRLVSFKRMLKFLILAFMGTLVFLHLALKKEKAYDNNHYDNKHYDNKHYDSKDYDNKHYDSHDSYCAENSEWLELNPDYFIKRTFSFYILEYKRYRTFVVIRSSAMKNYVLKVRLKFELYMKGKMIKEHFSDDISVANGWKVGEYAHQPIDYYFNLQNLVSQDIKNLDIKVFFYLINERKLIQKSLIVKVKSIDHKDKKSAILCSKCFYLKKEEAIQFKWWVELNKRIGYSKIEICNQSISNSFDPIFHEYKDFVILNQLNCVPNFLNNYSKYIQNIEELNDALKMDVLTGVYFKECYLENIDKYRYISVNDIDETVIPKLLKNDESKDIFNLKCNKYEPKINESYIELFIDNVKLLSNIKEQMTMNFCQGFYLKYEFIEYLFEKFNKLNLLKINSTYNLELNEINGANGIEKFYYKIKIESDLELEHARKLYKIYMNKIVPFRELNKNILDIFRGNFDRIFYVLENLPSDYCGKSIHDTRVTFDMTPHLPLENAKYVRVLQKHAHLSHFRSYYSYNRENVFSIQQLQIDLNYLNCFYIPIIQSLTSNKLVFK